MNGIEYQGSGLQVGERCCRTCNHWKTYNLQVGSCTIEREPTPFELHLGFPVESRAGRGCWDNEHCEQWERWKSKRA